MGKIISLLEISANLNTYDQNYTIYAQKPWTAKSAACVEEEPLRGGIPPLAQSHELDYFLELNIAIDVIEEWKQGQSSKAFTPLDICNRLIHYATYDA